MGGGLVLAGWALCWIAVVVSLRVLFMVIVDFLGWGCLVNSVAGVLGHVWFVLLLLVLLVVVGSFLVALPWGCVV